MFTSVLIFELSAYYIFLFKMDEIPPENASLSLLESSRIDALSDVSDGDHTIPGIGCCKTDSIGRLFVPDSFWKSEIQELPSWSYDVNGDAILRLPGKQAPKNQRLWKKHETVNLRKIIIDDQPFRGKSNYQNCKGSSFCPNVNCSYRVENKKVNTTRPLQGSKCRWCQAIVEHNDCKARRYIGYGDGFTIVAHYGIHDCDPTRSKPLKSLSKEGHVYFATRFQVNPRLTPAVVVCGRRWWISGCYLPR